MEETGVYGLALALYLYNAGFTISVINSAQIKTVDKPLSRTKTDKADARMIARFCQAIQPMACSPTAAYSLDAGLVRHLEAVQESNRLSEALPEIRLSMCKLIKAMEREIEAVQEHIPAQIKQHPDSQV